MWRYLRASGANVLARGSKSRALVMSPASTRTSTSVGSSAPRKAAPSSACISRCRSDMICSFMGPGWSYYPDGEGSMSLHDISAKTIDGEAQSLGDYKGKVVL